MSGECETKTYRAAKIPMLTIAVYQLDGGRSRTSVPELFVVGRRSAWYRERLEFVKDRNTVKIEAYTKIRTARTTAPDKLGIRLEGVSAA